jgi:hypothetical protein
MVDIAVKIFLRDICGQSQPKDKQSRLGSRSANWVHKAIDMSQSVYPFSKHLKVSGSRLFVEQRSDRWIIVDDISYHFEKVYVWHNQKQGRR